MSDLRELRVEVLPYFEGLVEAARRAGWDPRITSVHRGSAKQRKLYAKFLRGEMPYTVARPGTSTHELDIAADISVAPHVSGDPTMNDRLRQMGELWESIGGTWGGRFKDPVHFDVRRAYGHTEQRP